MEKTLTEEEIKELLEGISCEFAKKIVALITFIDYKGLLDEFLEFNNKLEEKEFVSKEETEEILKKEGVRIA